MVKLPLDEGGDVNNEGEEYGCPLGAAVYSGANEMVCWVLQLVSSSEEALHAALSYVPANKAGTATSSEL